LPHILVAVYVFSFSMGLVITTLSLVAHARFGQIAFQHVAIFFVSIMLLILTAALKTYEDATVERVFGDFLPAISCLLTVPGSGLLTWMMCVLAFEIVSVPVSPSRKLVHVILTVAAAACGGLKETLQPRFFSLLNDAVVTGIEFYAILAVVLHLKKIKDPRLLTLVRSVLAVAAVMSVSMIAQIIGQATFLAPTFLGSLPVIQELFFLAVVGILLFQAVPYLFQPEIASSYQLPDEIVRQYGISPREREIITMLVQGYRNKVIGEKLFISSITVKNHIYHIYQKTGVSNKVQLMNLISSPK